MFVAKTLVIVYIMVFGCSVVPVRRSAQATLHQDVSRKVSEYCSACVSRVGLSTKQATEPYSDNLVNRTRNPSEPYSDKEIPLRKALISWVLNWESTEN